MGMISAVGTCKYEALGEWILYKIENANSPVILVHHLNIIQMYLQYLVFPHPWSIL